METYDKALQNDKKNGNSMKTQKNFKNYLLQRPEKKCE